MERSMTSYLNEIYNHDDNAIDHIIGNKYDEFYDFYYGTRDNASMIKSMICNNTDKNLSLTVTILDKDNGEEFVSGLNKFKSYMGTKTKISFDGEDSYNIEIDKLDMIESVED